MPYKDGSVITDRWIKHIATITNRGHKVGGFGKKNKKYELLKEIGFLVNNGVENCEAFILKAGRIKDTGCSTSIKRLAFAKDNWHTFKEQDKTNFEKNVLPKFQFHYMILKRAPEYLNSIFDFFFSRGVSFLFDFIIYLRCPYL